MTNRRAFLATAASLVGAGVTAQTAPAQRKLSLVFIETPRSADGDRGANDGVFRIVRRSGYPGAELAVRDSLAAVRAAGVQVTLTRRELAPAEAFGAVLSDATREGADAVVADVPAASLLDARPSEAATPLINVGAHEDALRAASCGKPWFHAAPSLSMRVDALAQFLAKRNWRKLFILHGPAHEDAEAAEAMRAACKKFGVRVVDFKAFALGADPRRREEINPLLLTAQADYDAVFLADVVGDASRVMPFRLSLPRPTLGAQGLDAVAWHRNFERHGAPQLNRRFERAAGRAMEETDWAAWAAVRAIVEAIVLDIRADRARPLAEALRDPSFKVDLYKGVAGSFRRWDGQLRQTMLLSTFNAVVDLAPLEGFLHETNTLDTLGAAPSGGCPG